MKYKKAEANDTVILLSILVFQAFILISIGFLDTATKTKNNDYNVTITEYGTNKFNFVTNLISNISLLGWGNLILFAPLGISIIYIIAKLLRGGG